MLGYYFTFEDVMLINEKPFKKGEDLKRQEKDHCN